MREPIKSNIPKSQRFYCPFCDVSRRNPLKIGQKKCLCQARFHYKATSEELQVIGVKAAFKGLMILLPVNLLVTCLYRIFSWKLSLNTQLDILIISEILILLPATLAFGYPKVRVLNEVRSKRPKAIDKFVNAEAEIIEQLDVILEDDPT